MSLTGFVCQSGNLWLPAESSLSVSLLLPWQCMGRRALLTVVYTTV